VWGEFQLTYYYCASAILPGGFKNLAVKKGNSDLQVSWNMDNEVSGNQYIVEYSKDAVNFKEVGKLKANSNNAAAYKFNIKTNSGETGYRSIRIKQINTLGEVHYSAVRTVLLEQPGVLSMNVAPNPASKSISILFDTPTNGDFEVSLVNMAGQSVFKKEYKLRNSYQLNVEWPQVPPSGVYFLQTRNRLTNIGRLTKLVIRN
jgi:hypothetical protein